jgi:hypothetical protein
MRNLLSIFLSCCFLAGCEFESLTPQGRLDGALKELAEATTERDRFYALDDAAKESFEVGHIKEAGEYATDLLALAPRHRRSWNYGNAIQDGNIVLGRIAVRENRINDAKQFLEEAGRSPGSPQMDTFGPNMSLAKDLLDKGASEDVLNYFEACRRFWKDDRGRLDDWKDDVKSGRAPEFGANLRY